MCWFLSKNKTADWETAAEAMGRAAQRLEQEFETVTTGEVGVLVRPDAGQDAGAAKAEVGAALASLTSADARFDVVTDGDGHPWVVVRGDGLRELAAATGVVGTALEAGGLGDRVIAAIYPFRWKDRRVYWMYQPRVRAFTPFAPLGEAVDSERDHPLELRMEAALRKTLPTAKQISEWYPIWGMPV